jgi:hypothetical protein
VLLISLNKLYFFLGTFISWALDWWLLVLEDYLLLSKTMGVGGLKWRWDCIHAVLHEILLSQALIYIYISRSVSVFGSAWVLWRSNAATEVNLWRLLNNASSWFWQRVGNVKRLDSSIMSLNLLLESSLSLMAWLRSNNITRSGINVRFCRTDISLCKLVLYNRHLPIFGWVWHDRPYTSWIKLLADM